MFANRLATAAVLLTICAAAQARDWYVSPDGVADAAGDREHPLDFRTSLNDASRIKPGDAVWLLPGRYTGPFVQSKDFAGTAEKPIVYRAVPGPLSGPQVVLTAPETEGTLLTVSASHTWFWGMELTIGGAQPKVRADVIKTAGGDGVKLINLIIHENPNRSGIGAWDIGDDHEIHGCIIYRNGIDPGAWAHGVYTQNSKRHTTKTYRDCLIFNNFGFGVHCYSQEKALANFHFEGCVVYGNGLPPGSAMPVVNFLVGGCKDANDITVDHCYTWFPPQTMIAGGGNVSEAVEHAIRQGGGSAGRFKRGADFGYTAKNNGKLTVRKSTFVGGLNAVEVKNWHRVTFTDNFCYTNTGYGLMMTSPQGDDLFAAVKTIDDATALLEEPTPTPSLKHNPANSEVDRNQYHAEGTTSSRFIYRDGKSYDDLAAWQQDTGWDRQSTFVRGVPSRPTVVLRPNGYEPDRAHLIVYNWPGTATVAVDFAALWNLKPDEKVTVHNVEDLFGTAVLSGVAADKPVEVPMAGSYAPGFACYLVFRSK